MLETTNILLYSKRVLHIRLRYSFTIALTLPFFAPTPPTVWGALFEVEKIENALSAPAYIPQESQDLASRFVDYTLPKLLANDARLTHQLGFDDSTTATIDQALAVMVISRDDIMSLIERKAQPFDLVNNDNNWLQDEAGRLLPKRIVFLLKVHDSGDESGADFRSSVTMEQIPDGSSWRIIQVGAPKLSGAMRRAIRTYAKENPNHFLLWIPDINRHYLGTIEKRMVNLTVLFKDRLTEREPGNDQLIDSEFLDKLKRLYEDLDLPKKLRQREVQKRPKAQAR